MSYLEEKKKKNYFQLFQLANNAPNNMMLACSCTYLDTKIKHLLLHVHENLYSIICI